MFFTMFFVSVFWGVSFTQQKKAIMYAFLLLYIIVLVEAVLYDWVTRDAAASHHSLLTLHLLLLNPTRILPDLLRALVISSCHPT